jgi:transposase
MTPCVERTLPISAEFQDGNASDKKSNFSLLGDDIWFITRLPENFGACREIISEAIPSGTWQDVGRLSNRKVNGKEICASYRLQEEALNIEDKKYRAVVVHSDTHDRRRQKRIDNAVKKDVEVIREKIAALSKKEFYCLPDAQKAASELKDGSFYQISCSFESRPVYRRGRPGKDGTRPVQGERYRILATVTEEEAAVKKPHRIEAMGLVFILALLLWRLMERSMREKVKKENIAQQGGTMYELSSPRHS